MTVKRHISKTANKILSYLQDCTPREDIYTLSGNGTSLKTGQAADDDPRFVFSNPEALRVCLTEEIAQGIYPIEDTRIKMALNHHNGHTFTLSRSIHH